jgi:hypothetical protein
MRIARMIGRCVATGDGDASLPALTSHLWRLYNRHVLYPDVLPAECPYTLDDLHYHLSSHKLYSFTLYSWKIIDNITHSWVGWSKLVWYKVCIQCLGDINKRSLHELSTKLLSMGNIAIYIDIGNPCQDYCSRCSRLKHVEHDARQPWRSSIACHNIGCETNNPGYANLFLTKKSLGEISLGVLMVSEDSY